MNLTKLLADFDNDADFIADLMLTIINESKLHYSRLHTAQTGHQRFATNDLRRVAHLMKSTCNTLGSFNDSFEACKLEEHWETQPDTQIDFDEHIEHLLHIIANVNKIATEVLQQLDHYE